MSCSKRRTDLFVLIVLYLLLLKTLAVGGCKCSGAELDYGLDSNSSLPRCTEMNEKYTLVFFKVPTADCGFICYKGRNRTSIDATRFQTYFIEIRNYTSTRLIQTIQWTPPAVDNSKTCKPIDLGHSNEGNKCVGIFIPIMNEEDRVCSLQLMFFDKSSTAIELTTVDLNNLPRRSLQDYLKDISTRYDNTNLDNLCEDLNINIKSAECRPEDDDQKIDRIPLALGISTVMILLIFVLNAIVSVKCYRWKCKGKQGHSAERELAASHIIDNSTQLNTYHGTGPCTSTRDPEKILYLPANSHMEVALFVGNAHDYDEMYFEPASMEEELVAQIKKLGVAEISREGESLRLFEVLGSGAFGTVHKGLWLHYGSSEQQLVQQEVAVKSMDGVASEEERVKFLQEAAIMGQFNHPNIIMILGIVPDAPIMILIEIMKAGDLRNHILDINKSNKRLVPDELPPTLLSYSRQVASGMVYLALKKFVHRDLAARNILVSDNGTCKIADFGLSRDLQDATYYKSHGGKIPVKWTAPEALHYHKYSNSSDVWSYGCVLYEIWSLGYKPFHEDTNAEIIKKVATGFRLPPPPGCPGAIYDIMIQCWHPEAAQRPSFFDLTVSLQKPDFMLLQWSGEELKICTEEARTLGSPLDAGRQLHVDLQRTYMVGAEKVTNWRQESVNSEPSQNEDEYKEINV